MRRISVNSMLVSNGATSFMRISRSVISRIRIFSAELSFLKIAPGSEQIRPVSARRAQGHGRVAFGKPLCKLLAHASLHIADPRGTLALPALQLRGQLNDR